MKKILIVNDLIVGGGVEVILYQLATYLSKQNYEVTIATFRGDKKEFYTRFSKNIKYVLLELPIKKNRTHSIFWDAEKVRCKLYYYCTKLRLSHKYDICIALKEGYCMKYVEKLRTKQKYAWIHTDYTYAYWTQWVYGNNANELVSMKKFDKVICVSQAVADSVKKVIGDPGNLTVCYNPINFKEILYKEIPDGADTIIAMGNHEYYFENLSKKQYEYRFLKEIGRNTLYYDKWIKGYHFIALAPEHQESAMISENQITWLKEKLKESKDSRPIFVFLHQPFKDTVFGSENGSDIENNDELYDILKSYPQIIFFSGHSHYDLESEKTFFKREFNMINTSSIYYVMNYEDTNEPIYKTQGLVAEIYKSKVVIRRREFITKEWIGEPYIIKYKNDTYKSVR